MLRVLSLFAGIGGFDLGLERTGGFETVAFCEIEPKARALMAGRFPKANAYDDVRTLTGGRLSADGVTVDCIVGGFPCQDISTVGSRAGLGGSRSGLWFDYARLVGELLPRFVIVENSPELLACGFGDVLGSLASLGYDAEWDCIPASALGAPHDRDRVWLVAYPAQQSRIYQPHLGNALRRWLSDDVNPWATDAWDAPQAAICRVDDGIPGRVVRSAQLGNAVVPFIPELIGRAILTAPSRSPDPDAAPKRSASGSQFNRRAG